MDIASVATGSNSGAGMSSKDVVLLKKSLDLAKSMSQQLLQTLPPVASPRSANPPGVGGLVDLAA